ncbi:DUF4268 domain-containing protein, partial [Candidatus Sumerlaeota bacterium]|nr:DUF4268 domain-containing protein [Candidatus Sumerlaeota bacterium]
MGTNKAIFDSLRADQDQIEKEFGEALTWERLNDGRASRIALYRTGSIESQEAELETIRAWAIERLLRFKQVFGP